VHSGDSACVLPPHSLPYKTVREMENQTVKLAKALKVKGLMNVQYALKMNKSTAEYDVYIIEVNPRASRTVPFVAKATGVPVAKLAARIMCGEKLAHFKAQGLLVGMPDGHTAVKAPVFPFNRFPGIDPILSTEMKSTGEVMGIDKDLAHAYAKSQLGAGIMLPTSGTVFLSVRDEDKDELVQTARELVDMGFKLVATGGTCFHLKASGLPVERINKVMEGQPNIVDAMINGDIDLIINTTRGAQSYADATSIRRMALTYKIPYYTLLTSARAGTLAIRSMQARGFEVESLQSYFENNEMDQKETG